MITPEIGDLALTLPWHRPVIQWLHGYLAVGWSVPPKVGGVTGLNGFDSESRLKGSVPVQARDHRKRHCNQLSADSHQRDYALAA